MAPLLSNTFELLSLSCLFHLTLSSSSHVNVGQSSLLTHHVPSFTVHEIQSGAKDDDLKNILTSTGLLSIRVKVPTNSNTNSNNNNNNNKLLERLCECQPQDFSNIPNGDSRILADGLTTRSTIATATAPDMLPLSLPKTDITNHCGDGVYDALEKTRDYVSIASLDTFIPALDRVIQSARGEYEYSYDKQGRDANENEEDEESNTILSALNPKGRKKYNTISSIVRDANHLEHFHLYSKKEEEFSAHSPYEPNVIDGALDWHTDGGLFLSFIPGVSCANINSSTGTHQEVKVDESFRILMQNKEEAKVVFPESRENEIVVAIMLGAGSEHWLDTPKSLKLRATQHAVKMRGGDVRSWYGMMHLVPSDAIIQKEPTPRTFAEMKKSSVHSVSRTFSDGQPSLESDIAIGCGNHETMSNSNKTTLTSKSRRNSRRLQHVGGQDDCNGSGHYFCWLSCLATPNDDTSIDDHLKDGDSLYCLDPAILHDTGDLKFAVEACSDPDGTAGGIMSSACQNQWHPSVDNVQSYLKAETHNHDKKKYCYGSTAMYMHGFEWEGTTCVTFLFNSWILSSRGALIGACFGATILAILTELFTRNRRSILRKISKGKLQVLLVSSSLYALQVSMGYAIMLLIMTYSGPLVISVIAGLAIGHIIGNWNVPKYGEIKVEASTPCCQYLEDEKSDSTDASEQNKKETVV